VRAGQRDINIGIPSVTSETTDSSESQASQMPGNERRLVERRKLVLLVDASERRSGGGYNSLSSGPRRSGRDRRLGDRRARQLTSERERRHSKGNRRATDRRSGENRRVTIDRRRSSPSVFTREEAGIICKRALLPGSVDCPRCSGSLTIRPPIASSEDAVWRVRCLMCRRCLMIRNL
jgi:hypothetical protein